MEAVWNGQVHQLEETFFMDEMNAIIFGEDTKWCVPFHKKISNQTD